MEKGEIEIKYAKLIKAFEDVEKFEGLVSIRKRFDTKIEIYPCSKIGIQFIKVFETKAQMEKHFKITEKPNKYKAKKVKTFKK